MKTKIMTYTTSKSTLTAVFFFLMACAQTLRAQVPITPDYVFNIMTVAQIKANLPGFLETNAIRTQGYATPKDGGGAYYIVEARGSAVPNDRDIVEISDTLIARYVPENREVNVKQFGAKGDGVADDAAAIQAAIDYCLAEEIQTVFFPAGTYRLSTTLTVTNDGTAPLGRPSGLFLVGEGASTSTLKSLAGMTGPMIDIEGVPISGAYFNGGGIKNLKLDGSFAGNSGNHGIRFIGWVYGTIENCKIQSFNGDGIHQISDLTINSNPDWSASINMKFNRVGIERCKGYGFNNTEGQGAPGFQFEQCIFILCRKGGAYVQSSAMHFVGCSFGSNGWYSESDLPGPTSPPAYAIHFGGESATFNGRHVVESCEFDNNRTAHIACGYLSNSRIENNRFVHEKRNDIFTPPSTSVLIAPDNANQTVKDVRFTGNYARINSPLVTVYDWVNTANVINIYMEMNTVSDEFGGATIVPYQGYDQSNRHLKHNYVIDDRGAHGRRMVSTGEPLPFYLASITPSSVTGGSNNNLTTLKFDLADAFFGGTLTNDHYDIPTGVFTCPENGFYEIDVYLTLRNLLVNEQARMHIRKNGSIVYSDYVWGSGHIRTNIDLSTKFFANAGDQITVEISSSGTLQVEPLEAFGFNRLSIQLAD